MIAIRDIRLCAYVVQPTPEARPQLAGAFDRLDVFMLPLVRGFCVMLSLEGPANADVHLTIDVVGPDGHQCARTQRTIQIDARGRAFAPCTLHQVQFWAAGPHVVRVSDATGVLKEAPLVVATSRGAGHPPRQRRG